MTQWMHSPKKSGCMKPPSVKYRFQSGWVSEMIIDHDGGYRVYYGVIGPKADIVVLLHGGPKSGQDEDIKLAKKYWNDKEFNHGE